MTLQDRPQTDHDPKNEADEDQKLRKKIAYHEAGHAVAAYLLCVRFNHVSIVPEGGRGGHLAHSRSVLHEEDWCSCPDSRSRHRTEREIMVHLAGTVVDEILDNQDMYNGANADLVWAQKLSENAAEALSQEVTDAYMKWLWLRVGAYLQLPWNWAAVEAIADALVEHGQLGYRRARDVIRQAVESARNQHLTGLGAGSPKVDSPGAHGRATDRGVDA